MKWIYLEGLGRGFEGGWVPVIVVGDSHVEIGNPSVHLGTEAEKVCVPFLVGVLMEVIQSFDVVSEAGRDGEPDRRD